MRTRILLSAALLVGLALGASAAPAPVIKSTGGPPVILQIAPGQKLLENVKKIVGIVAGEGFSGLIDGQIQGKLGEKGFAGLDMTKPIVGYLYLPNKALKGPDDFKEIYGFVAIPVTGENEFKDFVSRLGPPDDPLNFKPIEGNKGLYALETNGGDHDEIPVRARFHDGYLYVGFNAKDELLDAKNLIPAKNLIKPGETGLVLARIFTDRFPEAIAQQQSEQFEELEQQIPNLGAWSGIAGNILKSYSALAKKSSAQLKDTEETGFRLAFDEKAAEIAIESYAMPKKGTDYAKELAAIKPTANRFASLISDTTAAGGLLQLPIATPELKDILGKLVEAGQKGKEDAPEHMRPVIDELLKGLGRTIKGDSIDYALAVNGPNKEGKFTMVAAVNFDDASGLEKALKAAAKHADAPEKFKDEVKFDVDEVEGLKVHRVIMKDDAEPVKAIFGPSGLSFVMGPKSIVVAMGPDWKDSLKAALAAKAGPSKVLDLVANPKRLGELITAGNEQAGGVAAQLLGSEDKRVTVLGLTYEGGEMLKSRFSISLKIIPKAAIGFFTLRMGG
ncbi:MAG: hypothetical protein JNK93_00180 [Planctomycetia bacterium]|nr:hypothetical protein [Planctomycetia bacterium]